VDAAPEDVESWFDGELEDDVPSDMLVAHDSRG
jgi:hypothetical protein